MTLRRQFHLLLAAVVVLPFLCVSLGPLYHWTHPEQTMPARSKVKSEYSQDNGKENRENKEKEKGYEQMTIGDRRQQAGWRRGEREGEGAMPPPPPPHSAHGIKHLRNMLLTRIYIPICVFIVVILYLVLRLSRTIFSSIQTLEEKTRLIADGDLNVTLTEETLAGTEGIEKAGVTEGKGKKRAASVQSNEIIELTNNLERMRLSLSDIKERRTRFIMGISHDLRTPIAVIKGYAEAITDGVMATPSEVGDAAVIIGDKAGQLNSMIEELISFVKLDSRDWRKSLERLPLKGVLEDFARDALSTGNVFHRVVKSNINLQDAVVPMDRRMFLRAMENLFGNAIRYSSDGDTIAINAYEAGAEYRVEVCDTGIGIAPDELSHIFDMFSRGTHSRREEGMGIGLAVVKSVADAHGWTINVRSALGEGTVFTICIPKETC